MGGVFVSENPVETIIDNLKTADDDSDIPHCHSPRHEKFQKASDTLRRHLDADAKRNAAAQKEISLENLERIKASLNKLDAKRLQFAAVELSLLHSFRNRLERAMREYPN
jgi:uncharacterized membrane protein YccC